MISSTEGGIMAGKKKKELSPSKAEQEQFLAAKKVKLLRKKLKELEKFKIKRDPAAAKRPGRPPRCDYTSSKRYNLAMPEIYYLFLALKAEKEDVPVRKIILDAIMKVHKKELTKLIDLFHKTTP
jgi:hypothetical protein